MNHKTEITIPADKAYLKTSLDFILSAAETAHLEASRHEGLRKAFSAVLDFVSAGTLTTAQKRGTVRISANRHKDRFIVKILNQSRPVFATGDWSHTKVERYCRKRLQEVASWADDVAFENLGRAGQELSLNYELKETPQDKDRALTPDMIPDEAASIRPLNPGEEPELTRLFHAVYGYDYVNDAVYFPEKIRAMIADGRLISLVGALPDGRLAGHVGLLRCNTEPLVYEAALGVVDPEVKNQGLFGKIFNHAVALTQTMPMSYCAYDLVTNHVFSQKLVARYDCRETALFLGNQVSDTQAKLETLGIGDDPKETDRYSLLIGITPKTAHPFGKELVLPANLGEACDFIVKRLDMRWVPAPRFSPLPPDGAYDVVIQREQKAAIFDFHTPGRGALNRMIAEWHHLLKSGTQYVAIDTPLDVPGIGQIYDTVARNGFFLAGFIPYRFSNRLGLRLQFLVPTKVAFHELKIYSETAKQIVQMVKADYERNAIL